MGLFVLITPVAIVVVTYFLGIHTICRVLNHTDTSLNIPLHEFPTTVFQLPSGMTKVVDLGCSVFLLDEDVIVRFLDEYVRMHDEAMIRTLDKYVIGMVHSTEVTRKNLLKDIQEHSALNEIVNLLLVVRDNDKFGFLTHRFVGNYPESTDLVHLDSYNAVDDTFAKECNLFPNKMGNLMGKTLRVATFYLVPWVMMRLSEDGLIRYRNGSYTTDGLDGYLLVQFCLQFNCTWELHVDQQAQYGQVFANRTGNGMLGALLNRDVDFAIGAVGGYYRFFHYFSISCSLQLVAVACLAPKPKLIPYWKIVFLLFSKSVWSMLLGTLLTVSFGLYILQESSNGIPIKSCSTMIFNTLRTFVLASADFSVNRPSEAILITSLLMFTVVIGNVYIGQIHSAMTSPQYQAPIDSMLDLVQRDIHLVAPHVAWKYSLEGSENKRDQMISANFHIPQMEDIPSIVEHGKEAIIMALLENGHSMVDQWFNVRNVEQYRLVSEPLYFEYEVGYATKTWPLLRQFNDWAMWIRDACLFQPLEQIEVYRYMDFGVQVAIAHSRDRPPRRIQNMNVAEISGAFVILGVGYVIALAVFSLELVVNIWNRGKV